ncbi:PucR family transcriptional regulator [Amycolatopsis panacis]|uniref:PucR family transcriptional regulator n=1 Tax=Amycolatopsis panacis TaxID=2340917 RepID=UPI001314C1B3|nr:PucR family transcriptional regulator [Amycolatopsis panacis]
MSDYTSVAMDQGRLLPTVREILTLPPVLAGDPRLLVGERWADRPVRWVHVCEQPDLARFIDAGDLVLTSGMGLQNHPEEWLPVLETLTERGASGLFLELGRYFERFPAEVVERAEETGLALAVFRRQTRFVEIIHSVHRSILQRHTHELERIATMHAAFTKLGLTGPSTGEILQLARSVLHREVYLEDLAHRLVAFARADDSPAPVMADWREHSLRRPNVDQAAYDDETGTLVVPVGTPDEQWGRLVIPLGHTPTTAERLTADRTADALALQRLLDADHQMLEWQTRETLVDILFEQQYATEEDALMRCRAQGFPLNGQVLAGGGLRLPGLAAGKGKVSAARLRESLAWINRIVRDHGLPVLAGLAGPGQLRLIVHGPTENALEAVFAKLADRVRERRFAGETEPPVLGFGSTIQAIDGIRRSCHEAADVVAASRTADPQPYYRLEDVQIHGFLRLLHEDPRLQNYTDRQLAPLLRLAPAERDLLLVTLRTYLDHGRNKAETARQLHLSRPSLYDRLERIRRILKADIEEPRTALSLQFAIHALDVFART